MLTYSQIFNNHVTYTRQTKHRMAGKYLSICELEFHIHYDIVNPVTIKHTISGDRDWYTHGLSTPVITSNESYHVDDGSNVTLYFSYSGYTPLNNVYVKDLFGNIIASVTGLKNRNPIYNNQAGVIEFNITSGTEQGIAMNYFNINFYNIGKNYNIETSLT